MMAYEGTLADGTETTFTHMTEKKIPPSEFKNKDGKFKHVRYQGIRKQNTPIRTTKISSITTYIINRGPSLEPLCKEPNGTE